MEDFIADKKILIIDDEEDLLDLIATVLLKEGFNRVFKAETGEKGLKLFQDLNPDFIILDIMLPDKEGYEVCKEIRKCSTVPILFLSAKSEEIDRILGFALGGDDYVTKPFSPKEIAYRIKAHLKRSVSSYQELKEIVLGPFEINEDKLEVKKDGVTLELTPKELKLFSYMAKHPNQIISKDRLCDEVWGEAYIGYDNTIMVHIRRLREKIESDPSKPVHIVNVKGLGYKFVISKED